MISAILLTSYTPSGSRGVVGAEIDGSANDGTGIAHGRPDTEIQSSFIGPGIREHCSTLSDV